MTLFTRNLNYLRAKTFGFPPPRHPGDLRAVFSLPLNVFIASYSSPRQSLSRGPQSTVFKIKRKNVDSRLKISGMTEGDGCLIKDFRHDG